MPRKQTSPGPTYVYRILCSHGLLLYVGVAVDVERRLKQHAATKPWWGHARVILTDRYATRFQALKVEAYFITYMRPKHNISGQTPLPNLPHPVLSESMYLSVRGEIMSEDEARERLGEQQ